MSEVCAQATADASSERLRRVRLLGFLFVPPLPTTALVPAVSARAARWKRRAEPRTNLLVTAAAPAESRRRSCCSACRVRNVEAFFLNRFTASQRSTQQRSRPSRKLFTSPLMSVVQRKPATIDDLPASALLRILISLPRLVDRARAALSSRRWAALLREPALWSELNLEGARGLDDPALLLHLCRRAGTGKLRSLVLPADSGGCAPRAAAAARRGELPLLDALRAGGVDLSGLEELSLPPGLLVVRGPRSARALLAACPRLSRAAVAVSGPWPLACAALRLLRPTGGSAALQLADPDEDDFAVFAAAAASALAACRSGLSRLSFEPLRPGCSRGCGGGLTFTELYSRTASADPAAAAEAAALLAAALADPERGPAEICCGGSGGEGGGCGDWCAPPAFAELFAALSPAAPLRRLSVGGSDFTGAMAAQLAAALASGRAARLEALTVWRSDLRDGGRCVCSLFLFS